MRLALLINRSAGTFRRLPLDATVDSIVAALAAAGHEVSSEIVGRRELARALSAMAHDNSLDAVVVGGGDGTILTAIVAGLGRDKPLGILPLGTLNLFARDLGLPQDPVEAARILGGAIPRDIDLAEVNGLPFAIWASMGMHPWVVRRRDHMQRGGMGKGRAMALAALRAFRRFPLIDVTLNLPEGNITVSTPMLFITNNPWREEPLPLSRETLDTGQLVIHVAACSGRLSLLWLFFEALLGHWRASPRIRTYTTGEVRVTSRKRRMMVSLDGEVTVMGAPLVFRARPKALRVLMPVPEGAA
ncbi:Magnetosome protein MamU [Paramagnetospirillum magnetotacticum MS-1]|uniref:Magnetosome protein MamU n=1 Tax=Paramagnetospirillum magnetotacticum MS-1 TaxID=272627 RepID=A0A0C2YUW3_PARME|nr:lipid kinase MamU [Paramagnetospirillum magnetotacticum]KIL98913.1 Magnetosome protein MamU [Paramagnetospirillum magnetotacticum MS-1]